MTRRRRRKSSRCRSPLRSTGGQFGRRTRRSSLSLSHSLRTLTTRGRSLEAIVTLPAEVSPRGTVELEVGYEGVIPLDATRLARVGVPDAIARHTSWDHIGASFTAVRGAGYVAWYPITSESADFSEGNSLFEVTDRLRARAAESEFKLTLTSEGAADSKPVLLCGAEAVGLLVIPRLGLRLGRRLAWHVIGIQLAQRFRCLRWRIMWKSPRHPKVVQINRARGRSGDLFGCT